MLRRISVFAPIALAGLLAAAQPALGLSYNDGALSGSVGKFLGPKAAEVVCHYGTNGRLRSMTVRPPRLWGTHAQPTRVSWQFEVRVAKEFRTGRLVYRSPVYKDSADLDTATRFVRQQYRVRESLPGDSAYYVRFTALWYAPAIRDVEGQARLYYDRYVERQGTQSFSSNACTFDYGIDWSGG